MHTISRIVRADKPLAALAAFGVLAMSVALSADSAHAQSRYLVSPFAARNGSLDGTPTLVGAALTTYGRSLGGIVGMRVGGAYDVRSLSAATSTSDTERGWGVDADAVLSPARFPVIGPLLGGFLPTVFTGIGAEGIRRSDGTGGQSIVTSYGAGVTRTIGGLLSIDTEARRRIPVRWSGASSDANDPNAIARRGWEYRLGVSSVSVGALRRVVEGCPRFRFPDARAARVGTSQRRPHRHPPFSRPATTTWAHAICTAAARHNRGSTVRGSCSTCTGKTGSRCRVRRDSRRPRGAHCQRNSMACAQATSCSSRRMAMSWITSRSTPATIEFCIPARAAAACATMSSGPPVDAGSRRDSLRRGAC